MNLNEIDTYLSASRSYIDDAKRRISAMGFCCPSMFLGDLETRQLELERIAWDERHRNGEMGFFWIIAGAVTAIGALGTYVYNHYLTVKEKSDYIKCLDDAKARNMSDTDARTYCGGGSSISSDITKTIKIAVYGGVALMALYVIYKFVGRKKK
jgi:hypothetical protein